GHSARNENQPVHDKYCEIVPTPLLALPRPAPTTPEYARTSKYKAEPSAEKRKDSQATELSLADTISRQTVMLIGHSAVEGFYQPAIARRIPHSLRGEMPG